MTILCIIFSRFSLGKIIVGSIFIAVMIAFKLWTLLIVAGALQEVKLEIKPKISTMKMSGLQA